MKTFRTIWICLAAIFLIAPWAWSQTRSVTFLPRDQEMESFTIDYTGKKYALAEAACDADVALYKFNRCSECMDARRECPDCCVKKSSNRSVAEKCTPADDAKYTARSLVFNPDNKCPAVLGCSAPDVSTLAKRDAYCGSSDLPHCQDLGCPGVDTNAEWNARPKTNHATDICYPDVTGKTKWICNTDKLDEPYYQECTPRSSTIYPCPMKIYGHQVVYDVMSVPCPSAFYTSPAGGGGNAGGVPASGGEDPPPPPPPSCYSYEFKNNYSACIQTCLNATEAYEQYVKDSDCCLLGSGVCCGSYSHGQCTSGVKLDTDGNAISDPGYLANCTSSYCQQKIDWPECKSAGGVTNELCCDNPALNDKKCLEYRSAFDKCLDPESSQKGACLDCFQVFGQEKDPFQYEFVARSNQKMIIIWQLHVTPHYCLAKKNAAGAVIVPKVCPAGAQDTGDLPKSYLYTMVKVFDITDGQENEVFPGTSGKGALSQRAFSGAFSIFAASAVDKKNDRGDSFLEQGRRYRIKLYWYIPKLQDYILSADVQRGEFTIIKVRE